MDKIPKKQLEDFLNQLGDEELDTLFSSVDPETQWSMYEKLNNTELGYILEGYVFDSGNNEEEDLWSSVFGDYGSFLRKKRQIDSDNEDIFGTENPSLMLSMGLQGFLMMDEDELPPGMIEVATCVNEILWEAEEQNKLCSMIPKSLKDKIREVLMMVLKQNISPKFFSLDFKGLMNSVDNDDIDKIIQKAMGKVMTPITSEDVGEMLEEVGTLWNKVVNKESNTESKQVLNLVSDLIQAINDQPILENIARVGAEVQGMMMRKESPAFMTGRIGPSPDARLLCEMYSTYKSGAKSQKVK